ncbi:hypothetical protein PMAYCL1PPCAC_09492, partial [Pristionchus mayeri]
PLSALFALEFPQLHILRIVHIHVSRFVSGELVGMREPFAAMLALVRLPTFLVLNMSEFVIFQVPVYGKAKIALAALVRPTGLLIILVAPHMMSKAGFGSITLSANLTVVRLLVRVVGG